MIEFSCETDQSEEVRAAVSAGLSSYNNQFLSFPRERKSVVISARDETGRVVGGLVGEIQLDWFYVDQLWLDEAIRKNGNGKALLLRAEASAKEAGCTHLYLWTWSFQAPEFYLSNGFSECGRIANHPQGHDKIYLVKWFNETTG